MNVLKFENSKDPASILNDKRWIVINGYVVLGELVVCPDKSGYFKAKSHVNIHLREMEEILQFAHKITVKQIVHLINQKREAYHKFIERQMENGGSWQEVNAARGALAEILLEIEKIVEGKIEE